MIKEKREPYPKFSLIATGCERLKDSKATYEGLRFGAERLIQHDNMWVYLLNANPKRLKN